MATKTQAQLDQDVIEAAERFADWNQFSSSPPTPQDGICAAVRARREAMRPHKAAVFLKHVCLLEWNQADTHTQDRARLAVVDILAAPDEPREGGE